MAKKNTHEEAKKRRQNYLISLDGHDARIKEQRKVIKEAKRAIKMHQLLKKQRKTEYKLESLSVAR
jgi:hypothetical protein